MSTPAAWRAAHAVLSTGAAIAALPVVLATSLIRPDWRLGLTQRLGAAPRCDERPVWFHAASLGEVLAFAPLAQHLGERWPLVLSTTTAAGRRAAERLQPHLTVPPFTAPADAWPLPGRALQRVDPRALILVETELWPHWIERAAERQVPLALVNGRLSANSTSRYRLVRPLFAGTLDRLDILAMRSEEDAERALSLGAPSDRTMVTGNLKFDAALALQDQDDLSWSPAAGLTEGPWVVFGSTAEGEEELLLPVFASLVRKLPELRLVLAPRAPRRFDEVAGLVERAGLSLTRRSGWTEGRATEVPAGGVLLLDSLGELARTYRHALVAFIGGSLVNHGGQNPLEPAAAGCPVLMGPHAHNFRDAEAVLLPTGGVVRVSTDDVEARLTALLTDPAAGRERGQAAHDAVATGRGATERTAELLAELIDS